MSGARTLAIDAMGGDIGPEMVIPSLELIAARHPDWKFILFGDAPKIERLLSRLRLAREAAEVRHTEVSIAMDDKPSQADRKSTRLNSSHSQISYAVFCLKKKKKNITTKLNNKPTQY